MKRNSLCMVFTILFLLCMQTVFAAEQQIIDPEFDFTSVRKIVILEPNYTPEKEGVPVEAVYGAIVKKSEKLSLEVLRVQDLKNQALERKSGLEASKEELMAQIAQAADLYAVPTVIGLEKRTVLYFEVYSAKTQKMLYSERFIARKGKDAGVYEDLTDEFCKSFNKLLIGSEK